MVNNLWMRMAFITRYGHVSLSEALDLEGGDAQQYMSALAQLLKEEKTSLED